MHFQASRDKNALSRSSGGVRSSSWARFYRKKYPQVAGNRNQQLSGTPDMIFEVATFFAFVKSGRV